MPDVPVYWTRPFVEQFVEQLRVDPAFQKAARKFADTVVFRCTDGPGRMDRAAAYRIDHGKLDVEIEEHDAPWSAMRQAAFDKRVAFARTTAPYAIWKKLDRGEMNVLQAIASPDYKLEGSKLKVVRNIGLFNAMSAVASRIPKTY